MRSSNKESDQKFTLQSPQLKIIADNQKVVPHKEVKIVGKWEQRALSASMGIEVKQIRNEITEKTPTFTGFVHTLASL